MGKFLSLLDRIEKIEKLVKNIKNNRVLFLSVEDMGLFHEELQNRYDNGNEQKLREFIEVLIECNQYLGRVFPDFYNSFFIDIMKEYMFDEFPSGKEISETRAKWLIEKISLDKYGNKRVPNDVEIKLFENLIESSTSTSAIFADYLQNGIIRNIASQPNATSMSAKE